MNYLKIVFFVITVSLSVSLQAHKKASYNIIIDTDCGIDDFRMLNVFLASKDFNINAILTSDGVLSPEQGAKRINGMLNKYNHQGIPVGKGISLEKSFIHRDLVKNANWNKLSGDAGDDYNKNAVEVLHESLQAGKNIIIASSVLTNIAELLKKYPADSLMIEKLIWAENPSDMGMNYSRDSLSAKFVLDNFSKTEFVYPGKDFKILSKDFFQYIKSLKNSYSDNIIDFYQSEALGDIGKMSRMIWDDCLPVFLLYPEQFMEKNGKYCLKEDNEFEMLLTGILDINKVAPGVVYKELPKEKKWLTDDIYQVADDIIEKHGKSEFQVVAMTNEFHGHLGIYSIMGAKMGLRVLDYFHIGLDEVEVISFAGNQPPLSCMNDGLQFSTGASLGYGTIQVSDNKPFKPEAVFIYKNNKIKLSLKEELTTRFKEDIEKSIDKYGLLTDEYWDKIRRTGIKYWLELDRDDIFEIEKISHNKE